VTRFKQSVIVLSNSHEKRLCNFLQRPYQQLEDLLLFPKKSFFTCIQGRTQGGVWG